MHTYSHAHISDFSLFLNSKKKDIVIDIDFWHINLWLLLPMSNYIITLHLQNTRWCYHDIYQGNLFLLFKFFLLLLLFSCSFFLFAQKKEWLFIIFSVFIIWNNDWIFPCFFTISILADIYFLFEMWILPKIISLVLVDKTSCFISFKNYILLILNC